MLQEEFCKVLCRVSLTSKTVNDFKTAIKRQYHNNWIVDSLPAASILDSAQFVTTQYIGFPVGYQEEKNSYLYNHVNIVLEYHPVDVDSYRIVGFYVEPLSVKHKFVDNKVWDGSGTPPQLTSCAADKHLTYDAIKQHQMVCNFLLLSHL